MNMIFHAALFFSPADKAAKKAARRERNKARKSSKKSRKNRQNKDGAEAGTGASLQEPTAWARSDRAHRWPARSRIDSS